MKLNVELKKIENRNQKYCKIALKMDDQEKVSLQAFEKREGKAALNRKDLFLEHDTNPLLQHLLHATSLHSGTRTLKPAAPNTPSMLSDPFNLKDLPFPTIDANHVALTDSSSIFIHKQDKTS
jgi:hypothetical protein